MSSPLAVRFGATSGTSAAAPDLSQEELANLTGLHRWALARSSEGEQLPRLDTILKASAGVGASPCELMAGLRWHPGREIEGEFYVEDHSASSSASGEWKARKA